MEYPIQAQTLEFLRAGLLGLLLGLHYDLLRLPRKIVPKLTWLLDLWFCISVLLSLLALALYGGTGQLQLFMLLGTGLGIAAYFLGPGRLFGPIFTRLGEKIKKILRNVCDKMM